MTTTTGQPRWSLRAATAADASWLADLKAEAMRADLQRLGYWDRDWARQWFLEHVMATRDDGRPFHLALDRGSQVRALYERHGFTHTGNDANGVDQLFERPTST